MSTRAELIASIRANPLEDAPRLMYADWLDEFGDCDRDAATAEFVRLSCNFTAKRKSDRMPKEVYPWLKKNWKRLVPTFLSSFSVVKRKGEESSYQVRYWSGRKLGLFVGVPTNTARGSFLASTILDFHRGFVIDFTYWASGVCWSLSRLIEDQPLVPNATGRATTLNGG